MIGRQPCHDAIINTLDGLAHDHRGEAAVIDARGALTFGQLRRAAHARAAGLGSTHAAGALRPVTATSDAEFIIEVFATWIARRVPLPTPAREAAAWMRTVPPVPARGCAPWKAIVSVRGGSYRLLVTHGEPPTCTRKAVALGMRPDRRAMIASPLHLNGPFEFAVRQILLGGTVVICPRFSPQIWVTHAARHRPAWAFLVPTQIHRLLDHAGATLEQATSSLDLVVHSSQPCPPDLRDRLRAHLGGERIGEYYGTAEYDGTFRTGVAAGGLPIDGAELQVTGPGRRPVPTGTVGTIEGRSRTSLTSHGLPGACPPPSAWQTVGDQGRLDDTGRLQLVSVAVPGRAIVGGINVALSRIRDVIAGHPAIERCDVSVVPDGVYGHRVTALARTRQPTLTADDLHAYCAVRLAAQERPSRLEVIRTCQPEAAAHADL